MVAESFPLAVRQTWFQPGKAPLKGGGNYNPLKVAKFLADLLSACMKGKLGSRCPLLRLREHVIVVNGPQTPSGKIRPRGAFRQSIVVVYPKFCRVGGTRRSLGASSRGANDETPLFFEYTSYLARGTAVDGPFGWGGTPTIRNHRGPKVSSIRSEIGCRVQKQKLA